ncbi:hypothetical protein FRC09_019118, partial [Ceratobasidium sp. 395]
MSFVCHQCTQDTLDARTSAETLRAKHEQLRYAFTSPGMSTAKVRGLILDIERHQAALFNAIESIQCSLEDIDRAYHSVQQSQKSKPWWRKVLNWFSTLLGVAALITALVPGLDGGITAACSAGTNLASRFFDRSQTERTVQHSRLGDAVQQTNAT